MNELFNLSQLVTQAIGPDGPLRPSNLPQGQALAVLPTPAHMQPAQGCCGGCDASKGGLAQQIEGVK
ncbi:hypothetical protein [Acidovorax sp. BL-A-41-H1]|uniref:hypothetical protein n=1 Tax=Acidovorax sp. BL-A-41-H1 TaxID=3421102 RepID=UPI003F7B313D